MAMDFHWEAASESRRKRRDRGLAGRDARLDVVTREMQEERLVGGDTRRSAI